MNALPRVCIIGAGSSGVIATAAEGYKVTPQSLEGAVSPRTVGLILNSPNNPTGQLYSSDSIAELGRLLESASQRFETTIYLISDEPYRKIIFDDWQVPSIFEHVRNSIVLSSFSKDLSLPGERIGYLAVHPEADDKTALLDAMTLATRILGFVNAPALIQRVVAQLQDAVVDNSVYARRRELFCRILEDAGYEFIKPKGAFYLFPKTPIDKSCRPGRCVAGNSIGPTRRVLTGRTAVSRPIRATRV